MEQKLRFGLFWTIKYATFEGGFLKFSWPKNVNFLKKNVASALKSCIICISFIILLFEFFGSKEAKYSRSIVFYSTGDTSLRDFYIMTLQIIIILRNSVQF